ILTWQWQEAKPLAPEVLRSLAQRVEDVCWKATSSAFSIKIPSNDIVYDPKAHIKAKKTAEFDDIAHSLASQTIIAHAPILARASTPNPGFLFDNSRSGTPLTDRRQQESAVDLEETESLDNVTEQY
ncbi:hypothetical protein BGZ91_005428, partial [Linnemannia elongata]